MNSSPQQARALDSPDEESADEVLYNISELAREFKITTRAIRFYEDEGLVYPNRSGRKRVYSSREYTRLKLIVRGKRLGFSLGEIRDMLDLYDSEPGEKAQLKVALEKSAIRKSLLQQQLEDINLTLAELEEFDRQCRERLEEVD